MVGASIDKEISREMKSVGLELSKEMLSKCVALAQNHKVDAAELARTWEAHSLNHNVDTLTEQTFSSYRAKILQLRTKSKSKQAKDITPTPMKRSAVVSRSAMAKRSLPSDPLSPTKKRTRAHDSSSNVHHHQLDQIVLDEKHTASPLKHEDSSGGGSSSGHSAIITPPKATPPNLTSYEHRTNAGSTVITYNPHNLPSIQSHTTDTDTDTDTDAHAHAHGKRLCQITQPYGHVTSTYRHMTDANRHIHLDRQLVQMTQWMMDAYRIPLPTDDDDDDQDNDKAESNTNATEMDSDNNSNNSDNDNDTFAPYEHVGVPRQSLQTNIGRICNSAHEGKLNPTTLLLEGSRYGSNGARIELDVEKLNERQDFSLFQGQIVCVEGYNLSGRRMVVQRLREGLPCGDKSGSGSGSVKSESESRVKVEKDGAGVRRGDMERTDPRVLLDMHHGTGDGKQDGNALKVYAAAGPYTTSQDLEYQPLMDLLGTIEVEQPDVVILMGPFVDLRQPKVETGEELVVEYEDGTERHVCFEQFFAGKIAIELENMYETNPRLKTQFVLVPSMDDAVAEPVYPQPPLENQFEKVIPSFPETEDMPYGSLCLEHIESAGDRKPPTLKDPSSTNRRIHLVSNPCTIQINEVTIGFTSLDAYMHMSMETVNSKLPPGSRLTRLAEHFVKQRSYYPIFPPASGNGRDFNLDITQREKFAMPVQPDVLILPSRLTCTAMDVSNGTTVVNPGHLVKGAIGGSFAVMDIHPVKKELLNHLGGDGDGDEKEMLHGVKDRIRVEVRRI